LYSRAIGRGIVSDYVPLFPYEPPELEYYVQALRSNGWIVLPTGSRIICPDHCRDDSDWDLILLCGGAQGTDLEMIFPQLVIEREDEIAERYKTRNFKLDMPNGQQVNLIELIPWEFQAWKAATELCTGMPQAARKEVRVHVFREATSHNLDGLLGYAGNNLWEPL
jgi:hypothetical protein